MIFRHPVRVAKDGKSGLRIRRGLGTTDESVARELVGQMNELLVDPSMWSIAMKDVAATLYDQRVIDAFYDNLTPVKADHLGNRERQIPLPSSADGYVRILMLGTTGAGKTTLVRQLIGTNPKLERFPSTSAAKTTISNLEIILNGEAQYRAVVTFFDRQHVRHHIEECVASAVLATVEQLPINEIERKLLEHSEQRFRLSYLLGTSRASGLNRRSLSDESEATAELSDDDLIDDSVADEEEDTEQNDSELSDVERQRLMDQLQEYVDRTKSIGDACSQEVADSLGVSSDLRKIGDSDWAAFEELLEEELYRRDDFSSLVDDIFDEVESRFQILDQYNIAFDGSGWPLSWAAESQDRKEFIKAINRFSSNYAPNFGRLLTPLVEGIRVSGPFRPTWHQGEPLRLVIMDGEGLGHTPDSASSISTSITKRYPSVDAIILVDNAAQPMQAAPTAVLRSLISSGHHAKLIVCFTHFDEVKGPNLPNIGMRKDHVLGSYDNACAAVGKSLDTQAENLLRSVKQDRVFFLSNAHEPVRVVAKSFMVSELSKLISATLKTIEPPKAVDARPRYDMINFVLGIQVATGEFHSQWRAMLNLRSDPVVPPEHWSRIKALSRRLGLYAIDEYDTLRPIADLIRNLRDRIYLFLQNPLRWEPQNAPSEMRQTAIDRISQRVDAELHGLIQQRLLDQMAIQWQEAYNYRGRGSASQRANEIRNIYNVAAPVPGEVSTIYTSRFIHAIRSIVETAIQESGGEVISKIEQLE